MELKVKQKQQLQLIITITSILKHLTELSLAFVDVVVNKNQIIHLLYQTIVFLQMHMLKNTSSTLTSRRIIWPDGNV